MTIHDIEKFKKFLEESFGDGINIRELRLSNDETEYIKKIYPKSRIIKSHTSETPEGKRWYRVSLKPLIKTENEFSKSDMEVIKQENTQLKQELKMLKRSMALFSK